jgi:hypothetical protein
MARYNTYTKFDDKIVDELDIGFVGFNNRLRPDQLPSGILSDSQNGRMARNGEWQTRKGIDNIKAPFTTNETAFQLPFFLINDATGYTSQTLTSGSIVSQKLRITLAQDLTSTLSLNMLGVLFVDSANITGISLTSGNHKVKVVAISASAITFELYELTYTSGTPGGTVDLDSAKTTDDLVNEIYGSCLFADPNSDTDSYIMLVANSKVIAVKVDDPSVTYTLAFPGTERVSEPCHVMQAFNKLFIFRDGDTPLERDLSATNINTSPAMQNVASGTYSQPVLIQAPASGFSITDNKATVDLGSSQHGYKIGDTIQVIDPVHSGLIEGDEYIVSRVIDVNEFEFFVNSSDVTASSSVRPIFSKLVSEGLGYSHMPAAKYGVYHQKRIAVPYRYKVEASNDTYSDRKIFDEIIISDILDTDTFDQIYANFRFNAGTSDFNVGMHSFSDDKLIVFNRNSIHLVSGSQNLGVASVQLLTNEVGLVARDSVIQVGNQILFLSDNGVYGANFLDLYNLRGNTTPLSESIQKTIDNINKDAMENAKAVYFDNKYYLAVPLNKRDANGNLKIATTNNALLIYNFLNKSWESIDTVHDIDLSKNPITDFEFSNILIAGKGSDRGIYVVNSQGGIHKLEVFEDGIDRVITDIGETSESETRVQGSATTRMFTMKSIDRKKFNNFELHLQSGSDNSSDVAISATSENIDSEPALDLKTAEFHLGNVIEPDEDVSVRGRIGNKRAYGLQVTLDSILGRPRFRSLKIGATQTNNSTSSVE